MAAAQEETQPLRPLKRFITDHDADGLAVFNTSIPEDFVQKTIDNGDKFALGYATTQYPVDFASDLDTYRGFLVDNPGVVVPGGSVLRIVDLRPGGESPMHRTVSLDYGVVLEGEIELVLDSGEVRLMQRGDHSVQRGTMHMWRNKSKTQWARMLYVLQEAKPIVVGGKELGEDYGVGMANVRPSGKH
jgi:quercetin dioxygenase-like cupin family protein